MERRVIIIGGAGLVGTAIARALQAGLFDLETIVFDRREPPDRVAGIDYNIGNHVDIFNSEFVLGLVKEYEPMVIIDAVNIASLASRSGNLLKTVTDYCFDVIDKVARTGVIWIDIGTVATGGMGTEIPYTHNEACNGEIAPGLKNKNAAASIHGGFLDLLGRTPNQRIGRVVPRAMIGFEPPIYGPMFIAHLGGVPHQFLGQHLSLENLTGVEFRDVGEFHDVGCRCGENGFFGLEETAAITTIGQMETVTAEAVAAAAMDVLGRLMANSGTCIQSDLQPDTTSFAARNRVVKAMENLCRRNGTTSVCFGNLGPYLTTHLWELWALAWSFTPNSLADFFGEFSPDQEIVDYLAGILPCLGIPVLTDKEFIPCVGFERDGYGQVVNVKAILSVDEVRDQLVRCQIGNMWFVDLRTTRVAFWAEQARLIAECQTERSNLPLDGREKIRPGEFWAAFSIARGHGRGSYTNGSRHS